MSRSFLVALATVAASSLLPRLAAAQGERYTVSGDNVALYDLAGEVRLQPGGGSDVVVNVTRLGADAGKLRVVTGPIGGRQTLRVIFPADQISYPRLRDRSSTTLRVRDDGTFDDEDEDEHGGERVRISRSGGNLEAGADLDVTIPEGKRVSLHLAVGSATVTNVNGDLRISANSADLSASGTRGRLHLETGSGDVKLTGTNGDVKVSTGSGDATATDVRGDHLSLDTGSGSVTASNVTVARLSVDVGSGSIHAATVNAPDASFESGSGSIDVDLTSDVEELSAESGSGDVTIRFPASVGAEIDVSTGSGSIRTELPIQVTKYRRDELSGRIGDGRGRIKIETGSGSVELVKTGNRE
jgi:hypothetical protein